MTSRGGPASIPPLPYLAVAFAAGVWFAGMRLPLGPTAEPLHFFPLAALAVGASILGARRAALALLALAFFLAGWSRGPTPGPGPDERPCADALGAHRLPPPDGRGPSTLRIEGEVAGRPVGAVATVAIRRAGPPRERPDRPLPPAVETPGLLVRLRLGAELLAGDRIVAEVALDEPARDGPDAERRWASLAREGIACVGRVVEGRIAVVDEAGGLFAAVERKRRLLLLAFRERLPPGPAAALIEALALGERSAIDEAQNGRFADSGLAHLLSVSGLHLALTVLGFFRALRWLLARSPLAGRVDPQRLAAIGSLPLVPAYALLTGASPPVLRAAVAAGLYLVALAGNRAPDAWSSLSLALLALLAWNPALLHSPSIQLSFAACWGLLALAGPLRQLVPVEPPGPDAPPWRRWIEQPIGAAVATAAATLATLPFTALHFERFSLASLPANVVAVPVGLVATALCALASAAGLLHPTLLDWPLRLALPCTWLLDRFAAWFASWPGARIPVPATDPLLPWALALAPLGIWCCRIRRGLGLAVAGGAILFALWLRLPAPPDGRLHIEFLPVGQGDATLLRLPDGSALLVDAGGDPTGERDVGRTRVLPQLRRRGIDRLAALVVSHLHPDHVGGMPAVIEELAVDELWTTGRPLQGPWGDPLAEAIRARGVSRRTLSAGMVLERAGVRIEVLHPPDPAGSPDLGENDASLVLRVVHGDVAILLPGDVEAAGEWALLDSGRPIAAQLLKAPHHGSKTSSSAELLDAVRPHHVVFCVGHRNRFGFPHEEVVERYEARRCEVHRTDLGEVRFVSDGRALEAVRRRIPTLDRLRGAREAPPARPFADEKDAQVPTPHEAQRRPQRTGLHRPRSRRRWTDASGNGPAPGSRPPSPCADAR